MNIRPVRNGIQYSVTPQAMRYRPIDFTHPDENWRNTVRDVRFRKAVNMAIDHEKVVEAVYQGFGTPPTEITGLSYLPYDGGKYRLAPYEEITEGEYTQMMSEFPDIDWSMLQVYETEDMGSGAKELACVGGACEIDWDKMAMENAEVDAEAK